MQHMKTPLRRRVFSLFCAVLLFCSLLAPAVYADNAVISTTTMYSYFQTYNTSGTWVDLQTPAHWITSTGEVAYCLQTSKDNPYNAAYTSIDGELVYDDYVLAGLRAILTHGYPADDGGFGDQPARYATANAIRFWLAECHADGVPQYLNLTVNGQWIRGKSGCEDLFDWSLWLLELARSQSIAMSDGSLTFSPSEINLIQDGQYFTGTTYLTKNISGEYSLMDDMPDGKIITGHTGVQSENLTIQIPVSYPNSSYTLCAYGFDETPAARLFFWAPSSANQQRIVTYVLDDMEKTFVRGFLKVNTPGAVVQPQEGSLQITKTDTNGNPLSGVGFTLYDSSKQAITAKTTNGSGVVIFSGLELGSYYYAETSALPGYVQDSTLYPVSISSAGQTVQKTMTNSMGQGSLQVIKTDENGVPLPGVHFILTDAAGIKVNEGDTDKDGKVLFASLLLGTYFLKETSAPAGYELDDTPIQISLTQNGDLITKTITNSHSTGSVSILKTDSSTGAALAGAHFKLTDASGSLLKEGDTGSDGTLTFTGIPIGTYYLAESAAPSGYVLDSTPVTVEITTGGQTVSKTFVNAPAVGSIAVTKTDAASGAALVGVHFKLVDANGSTVKECDTDSNGTLSFTNVPLGSWELIETATVDGYVLDSTPVAVELTQANQTVTKNLTNARARGSVLIRKTASDTGYALPGVQFELLDQSGAIAASGVTGSDGTLLLDNLPLGSYSLKETQTVSGYALKAESIPVSVTQHGQTVEVSVTNDPVIGSLKIIKKAAGEDTPLAGAGYRLFSQDGTQLSEGYTNDAGELLFEGIPYGSGYYYQEFAAPKGFVLDEGKYPLAVTETESAVVKTHENRRREGTLQVLKQDHQGQPLSNAMFLLEYSQDNGKTWTPVTSRASGDAVTLGGCTSFGLTNGQLISGADGKAVFTGLRANGSTIYRVTETRAPQGYSLMADPLYVGTLPVAVSDANIADSETVDGTVYTYSLYITATDNPIYRLPETGGHGFRLFPIGLFF